MYTTLSLAMLSSALAAPPAPHLKLQGEASGRGDFVLGELTGRPTAILMFDRASSDAAYDPGDALNRVMVAKGGNRISLVDLAGLWHPLRPIARAVLKDKVETIGAELHASYRAHGQSPPSDLHERALLVMDWEGTWRPMLAPTCPGMALIILDAQGSVVERLCSPTARGAARLFRKHLDAFPSEVRVPPPRRGTGSGEP